MSWISSEERLPEDVVGEKEYLLVHICWGKPQIIIRSYMGHPMGCCQNGAIGTCEITHWQEVPPLPPDNEELKEAIYHTKR